MEVFWSQYYTVCILHYFVDEEISAMRSELEKYGIQMPAFSKIGGILANEVYITKHKSCQYVLTKI